MPVDIPATPDAAPGQERPRYHHGDLRAALLSAAEAELDERGVEAFSLRRVAKRAGVSHAAPAHHFGDSGGLLTALCTDGYLRFLAAQRARQAGAASDGRAQLVASGLAYVAFAQAHPALFRLMFASDRPDMADPALQAAACAAYDHLSTDVARARGGLASPLDEAAAWAMVHGLADLLNAGRLGTIAGLTPAAREAALAQIVTRALG